MLVCLFSVPYVAVELPSNLLMKKFGANLMLPLMVILWGMVCACQGMYLYVLTILECVVSLTKTRKGAVKSYSGLLVTRFFLGALEGEYPIKP